MSTCRRMSFKFNFGSDDGVGAATSKEEASKATTEAPAKEHHFGEQHLELLGDDPPMKEFGYGGEDFLTILDGEEVASRLKIKHIRDEEEQDKEKDQSVGVAPALFGQSDLVAGVYEGGLKIWECSQDLTQFLYDSGLELKGKRVLELGCGAALPGIFCVTRGAHVDFQVILYKTSKNDIGKLRNCLAGLQLGGC